MRLDKVPDGAVFCVAASEINGNHGDHSWAREARFRRDKSRDTPGWIASIHLGGGDDVNADSDGYFSWHTHSIDVVVIDDAACAAVIDKRNPATTKPLRTSDLLLGEAAEVPSGNVVLMTGEGPVILTGEDQWEVVAGSAPVVRRVRVTITIEEQP